VAILLPGGIVVYKLHRFFLNYSAVILEKPCDMERYTLFKSTGTHSDVIAAIGAADVLRELEPRLANCGDRFEVRLAREAVPADMAATDPGFLFLPKSGKVPSAVPSERIFEVSRESDTPRSDRIAPAPVAKGKRIDPEQRMYSIL
jgi:hypothetical protein